VHGLAGPVRVFALYTERPGAGIPRKAKKTGMRKSGCTVYTFGRDEWMRDDEGQTWVA
jgi:hypothetical protein